MKGSRLMEKKVSKVSISLMMVLSTSEMFISRKMEVAMTEMRCYLWWIFISIPYSMPIVSRVIDSKSQTNDKPYAV